MYRPVARRLILSAMFAAGLVVSGPVMLAQAPAVPAGLDQRRADEVRDQLRRTLEQYPPTLGRVFVLDPSLMTSADYLSPYPALAAFFQAHPEVPRHPDYFLNFIGERGWSEPRTVDDELRQQGMNMQRQMIDGLGVAAVFFGLGFAVLSLVRLFINHRRWIRATRLQSELNNRLFERMGSNEQLLTYLQSQAGQQLMATPVVVDQPASAIAAPFSRILWAVQAGIVLISGGVGFLVIRNYVIEEAGQALLTVGVLAIAVGAGFALASVASYLLSRRFGLLETSRDRADESGRV